MASQTSKLAFFCYLLAVTRRCHLHSFIDTCQKTVVLRMAYQDSPDLSESDSSTTEENGQKMVQTFM